MGQDRADAAGSDVAVVASPAPEAVASQPAEFNLVDIAGPATAGYSQPDVQSTGITTGGDNGALTIAPLDYTQYGDNKVDNVPTADNTAAGDNQPVTAKWSDAQQQITDGIDRMVEAGELTQPVKDVKVVYQDYNPPITDTNDPNYKPPVNPDFVVDKDGTVTINHNPDRKPEDPVIIQVQRDRGQTEAPEQAQQEAIDGLVKYIADKYMQKSADGKLDGKIEDDQGLVTDATKQKIAPDVVPSDLPSTARQQTDAVNRWDGAGSASGGDGGGGGYGGGTGGRISPEQQREYFPPRDVPRQTDESDRLAAIKDVVAGFASRGDEHPYSHVEARGAQGWAVGRYGFTSDQISSFGDWLSGLSDEQIEELIKKGVLPKGIKNFIKRIKSKEGQAFLKQLKDGKEKPSKEDLDKFFGGEDEGSEAEAHATQEATASYLITKYNNAFGPKDENDSSSNIGKIALSMQLGRVATEEDFKNPEYQKLMNAAEKAFPLSLQRVINGEIPQTIDLSDKAKSIAAVAQADVGKALWTEQAGPTQQGYLGCAASVSKALRQAGAVEPGFNENGVYYLDQHLQKEGWKPVDFAHRQPGDVIIGYRTTPSASGGGGAHTGIVGDGGRTYSNSSNDRVWREDTGAWNSGYQQVFVLRPPGSATA